MSWHDAPTAIRVADDDMRASLSDNRKADLCKGGYQLITRNLR